MREEKWEMEMPEVPDNVHKAVKRALDLLEAEQKEKVTSMKGRIHKRKIAVATILAAAMIGTTALAAGLTWNDKTVEEFRNPSEELQQKTLEEGVAVLPEVSVTDNGITVTAVQLLQDENRVYLMLKVESEEAVIDGNTGFDGWELSDGSNENIFWNMGGSFITDETGEPAKEGYYVIDGLKGVDGGWNGDTLQLALSDLSYYTYENYDWSVGGGNQTPHRIEGNWNLELALQDVSSLSRTIPVNKELTLRGMPVTVNYIKVSPLSVVMSYSWSDIDRIEREEDNFFFELCDIRMKDKAGNVVQEGYGGISSMITEEGEYLIQMGLMDVLDVEEIGQILWGEENLVVDIQ